MTELWEGGVTELIGVRREGEGEGEGGVRREGGMREGGVRSADWSEEVLDCAAREA